MSRSFWVALVAAALAWLPAAAPAREASAQPTKLAPQRSVYGEREEAPAKQRNAGAIDGLVTSVDYKIGVLTVQTVKGRVVEVVVLPSTSITAEKNGFHTIADIAKGAKVHVLLSRRGEHFIAQIINLK
jgi:hypothetical protein